MRYFSRTIYLQQRKKINCIYATESNLKYATGVNISKFAKEVNIASLRSNIDDLNNDKLITVDIYVDLYNLIDVVEKEIVKRTTYHKLVKKVNAIQTTGTSDLVKQADYNAKIYEIENKISSHDKYITTRI